MPRSDLYEWNGTRDISLNTEYISAEWRKLRLTGKISERKEK